MVVFLSVKELAKPNPPAPFPVKEGGEGEKAPRPKFGEPEDNTYVYYYSRLFGMMSIDSYGQFTGDGNRGNQSRKQDLAGVIANRFRRGLIGRTPVACDTNVVKLRYRACSAAKARSKSANAVFCRQSAVYAQASLRGD